MRTYCFTGLLLLLALSLLATQHHIGPGQTYENINDFPCEELGSGDTIYIHYRLSPYKEKWVINAVGPGIDEMK